MNAVRVDPGRGQHNGRKVGLSGIPDPPPDPLPDPEDEDQGITMNKNGNGKEGETHENSKKYFTGTGRFSCPSHSQPTTLTCPLN